MSTAVRFSLLARLDHYSFDKVSLHFAVRNERRIQSEITMYPKVMGLGKRRTVVQLLLPPLRFNIGDGDLIDHRHGQS